MKEELEILSDFETISLSEMDEVALMDRHDTKYVMSRKHFRRVLLMLSSEYRVLEVVGKRISQYENLYFDAKGLPFYHHHQRGKRNRVKVRMRKYTDSDITFLEIKHKNNKGRTIKSRKQIEDIDPLLDSDDISFLNEAYELNLSLNPAIANSFHRITLVHKEIEERLTFDLELKFETNDHRHFEISDLVIAELKQDQYNRESTFAKVAKQLQIRPERLSKYCLGIALLFDDVKKNQIKRKLRRIAKISDELAA